MNKVKYINLILFGVLLIFFGCIEENPDLVNPPSQKETVRIRLINLASDFESRTLNVDGEDYLNSAYGETSEAKNPTSDSIIVTVKKGSQQEFKFPKKVKFVRTTYTTFLALPTPFGADTARSVDTLVYFASSSDLPTGTTYSYIKFVNAYPDTTCSFSAIDGCPNGIPHFSQQRYRTFSAQKQVRAGSNPISIVKNSKEGNETIGLFDFILQNDMQYTIIVSADAMGKPVVNILDEYCDETAALARPVQIYENNAFIRTINFSTQDVDIMKSDEIITKDITAGKIGNYDLVAACGNQFADSIRPAYSGFSPVVNTLSLNVNEKYTYIIADSANKRAGFGIVVPQAEVDYLYNDRALIRVLNLDSELGKIYLTTAARSDTSADNMVGGETIGNKIGFGELSGIYPLYVGDAKKTVPLTLFRATSPSKLVKSVFADFEPGKSYLVVIKKNSSGKEEVYVVEDEIVNSALTPCEIGQFYQFVNYLTGRDEVAFSLAGIIENGLVKYSLSAASVARLGENSLNVNGEIVNFSADENNADVLIATGAVDAPRYITLKSHIPNETMGYSARRFVNAAADVPTLAVLLDSEKGDTTAKNVNYLEASNYFNDIKQRSYSLFFYDTQNNKLVYRLNEVKVIHGKIYTFILGGNAKKGYNVTILQEY